MDCYIFTSCKKNKKQEFSVDLTTSCWSPDVFAENLLVITVATEETDGFLRFMRTAQEFNYTVKVTHTHTSYMLGNFVLKSNLLPGEVSVIKE